MRYLPFVQRASWIWSGEGSHAAADSNARSPSHYQVRRFRREFTVPDVATSAARLVVHVSADSRYVLFVNGTRAGRGPARGDINHHFYDTYDLTGFLRPGANVMAALVFDMSKVAHRPSELGAPCAIMTYAGGFLLEGGLVGAGSEPVRIDTGESGWKVDVDRSFRFQNDGTRFEGYHGYFEHRISSDEPHGWTAPGFDSSGWDDATILYRAERIENRRDPASPYGLIERMIPHLEERAGERYASCFLPGGGSAGEGWERLIAGDSPLTIAPRTAASVILDVERMTTAYPAIFSSGGAGTRVRMTYSEALRLPWTTPGARMLGKPQPLANLASHFADESSGWTFDRRGSVTGWSDVWEPAGLDREEFEPWHWRSFRFVQIDIETGDEPLSIERLQHRFTAYPFETKAAFSCSDARLERIWSAAIHTMRLGCHETFEDCPHYEQMQYAGDTMITSRIAMLTSGDYRLTRQALFQFDWSRLPEGLTQSRYPSRLMQVIPSWSLHWITCIRDYAYCSGDLAVVRELLPGACAVLEWFRRHANETGLPAKLPFWNITDWCPWWPRGVVPGADSGPTCIIASQYVNALREVADLFGLVDDRERANQLNGEADKLRGAINAQFWSEERGLYLDRPGGPEVSQYGNAWAIVCGAAGEAQRRALLDKFPSDAQLAPGSFFCWHAIFRALDICGCADRITEFLQPWHEQVDSGLDTFVEENSYWRSLCHAWSAHPAIDFLTRILGVSPTAPGFASVEIRPHRNGLEHAKGRVCTPLGPVDVDWRVVDGRFHLKTRTPAGAKVTVVMPDGTCHESPAGGVHLDCRI